MPSSTAHKRYATSERGKALNREYQRRFRATKHGSEAKRLYRQEMTPYLYAMHDMVRETFKQLPPSAREQFAAEMVDDSLFQDIAYRCEDVEELIVLHFCPEVLDTEAYENKTDEWIGARRYAKILAGLLLA